MTSIEKCRLCGSPDLVKLFSLGDQYISDFVEKDAVLMGDKVPITLVMCRKCTLVQQKYSAKIPTTYWYRSGVTDTMKAALRDVTDAVEKRVDLKRGDVVLDIGSNDGTLLRSYSVPSIVRVGVEPADNVATAENYGGLYLVRDFWPLTNGELPVEDKAKVITAIGCLYDLEDPSAFIADIAKVLALNGLFVAQLMCLRNTYNVGDIGNFCHEHIEFYSLESLINLLGKHGLEIVDVETNKVNGQSYRLYIKHLANVKDVENSAGEARLFDALRQEVLLDEPSYHRDMFEAMSFNRRMCYNFIKRAVDDGKTVWGYGASTKGNVILQAYGLDSRLITAIAERSPEKVGKYTVGTGIPIVSEELMRVADPDYLLVLPYSFIDEFKVREAKWVSKGGHFILPLPEFKVI